MGSSRWIGRAIAPSRPPTGGRRCWRSSRSIYRRRAPWLGPAPVGKERTMCTWITEKADVAGHGKGVASWIPLTKANVYYDHPVSAPLDHALIIDFVNEAAGPGARVSVELSADSAQALLHAIQAALDSGAAEHGHPLVAAGY